MEIWSYPHGQGIGRERISWQMSLKCGIIGKITAQVLRSMSYALRKQWKLKTVEGKSAYPVLPCQTEFDPLIFV